MKTVITKKRCLALATVYLPYDSLFFNVLLVSSHRQVCVNPTSTMPNVVTDPFSMMPQL
ncbi:hypothetical protein ABC345_03830 [Shouchella sp. 1P09AA]|uniref:hypothetical protein n=1 Tax=unclassified Shouchella TaxID=2893065 RepID=UPI00399FA669